MTDELVTLAMGTAAAPAGSGISKGTSCAGLSASDRWGRQEVVQLVKDIRGNLGAIIACATYRRQQRG